jgi:CHAT domain-containing protein
MGLGWCCLEYLRASSESNPGILLVTIPSTDGQVPFPEVTTEVNGILETLPTQAFRSKVLGRPSSHQVLEELPLNQVMHFAYHGVSDKHDPSNSRLLLNNSELSVRDISRVNTEAAQLVYLSACSTAENPSWKLANEVIHIASGFLLAGFSHVLATLWESQDACS